MAARTRRQKDEKEANAQQSTAIYVQSAPFSLHCIAANGRQQKINKSQVKNGATIKPKWHRTRRTRTNKQINKQTNEQTKSCKKSSWRRCKPLWEPSVNGNNDWQEISFHFLMNASTGLLRWWRSLFLFSFFFPTSSCRDASGAQDRQAAHKLPANKTWQPLATLHSDNKKTRQNTV